MAEHIAKIKERNYAITRPRGLGAAAHLEEEGSPPLPAVRGGRGGRGRGRGRAGAAGGRGGGSSGNAVQEFIPSTLGVALIQGYEELSFETSLAKPFLRKEVS